MENEVAAAIDRMAMEFHNKAPDSEGTRIMMLLMALACEIRKPGSFKLPDPEPYGGPERMRTKV